MVTGMNKLLEIIVTKTNRYTTQNSCNFETTENEMKVFLGINFLWVSISYHLRKTVSQHTNVLEMKRFKTSGQDQGFSPPYRIFTFQIMTMRAKLINNTKSALVTVNLNKEFPENLSNSLLQSVEKQMYNCKGRLSMK